MLARIHQGEVYVLQSRLPQAMERYEEALVIATIAKGRRLPVAGNVLINIGRVLYEWNELDRAELLTLEGIELTRSWAPVAITSAYAILALIHQARGDIYGARRYMESTMRSALEFDAMSMDDDYYAARRWAEQRGLSPQENWSLPAAEEAGDLVTYWEYLVAASAPFSQFESLSARELQVLQLIAQGLTNREIARDLVLSLSTVKVHTYNIYGKLGVHSCTRAVARARELGLLDGQQ